MGLSDELDRPFPRILYPMLPRRKSALELAADEIEATFGIAPKEFTPREDDIARVEAELGDDGSGVGRLQRRDLKLVPYIIWGRLDRWHRNGPFIRRFLAAVDRHWHTAPRQIWRHYVVNFDATSPATIELAAWLGGKADRLPTPLRLFSDTFSLFEVEKAPLVMALSVLEDNGFVDACKQIGLSVEGLRASSLVVSLLNAIGCELELDFSSDRVPERLTALLSGDPRDAILTSTCADGLKGWR